MFFLIIVILLISLIGLYERFYQSQRITDLNTLIQKKEAYNSNLTNTHKYLVVGGSEVLYSFDTDYMSKELGLPVVNLGTNIGFGAGFIIDLAKKNANPGDTIILSLGYALYFKPLYDVFAYEYFRMYDRPAKKKIPLFRQPIFLVKNALLNRKYVKKEFTMSKSGAYTGIHDCKLPKVKQVPLKFKPFTENEVTSYLKDFQEYCYENEITLKITFPDTVYFQKYEDELFLQELADYLQRNFEVIGKPADFMYEVGYFYNSVYHVNECGQKKRTVATIQALKKERE